jgi:hypothetical protein
MHLHSDGLSRPLEDPRLRVLSLGAGVQSSTLALMSARGDLPPLDAAIFADTQSEPAATYRHLEWLEAQLPFPVHRVTIGSLRHDITVQAKDGSTGRFLAVPFHNSAGGFGKRQCTRHYKIDPVQRRLREMLGLKRRQHAPKVAAVELWVGISTDEIHRLKAARKPFIHNRHPLIEARMSRRDCLAYLAERQLPQPPKSACTFCPYHSNATWRDMAPEDFADACEVDRLIRDRGTRGRQFIHRTLQPLAEVDFTGDDDPQGQFGFANECEGMCGN